MVNHARTLLLNETQRSLAAAGHPYGYPWFVSPSFGGLDVPTELSGMRDAIFYGAESDEDRFSRVDAVMSLLGAVDMAPFMAPFDRRTTVVGRLESSSIRELFENSRHASHGFEEAVLEAARSARGLFSHIGDPAFDKALDGLSGLARGSFEGELRVAACIAAYCVQLEGLNRRSSGG